MPKLFKVFISSTWKDLQAERNAVERAIRRMRNTTVIGMEYFGSHSETPRDVSLQEVDGCNLYVGIFARYYGSGITEDEYRRAVERDVPVKIYIKEKSIAVPPEYIEIDPCRIVKLNVLLQELESKHTVSFFTNPNQLATQVISDLYNHITMSIEKSKSALPTDTTVIESNDRSIVVCGSVAESTFITGNGNIVDNDSPLQREKKIFFKGCPRNSDD